MTGSDASAEAEARGTGCASGYNCAMAIWIEKRRPKNRFTELASRVEHEAQTIDCHAASASHAPDLVPHRTKRGVRF